MKKKTRKKVVRRKRRSMREKRVMQIKRGLMKRAKKLRLGAKRTGAYVYGTLRRIVGNPDHRTRIALQTVRRPMEGYFLGGPDLEESVRFLLRKGYTMAQLKKINPDVEDELSGKKSILPNSRRGLRGNRSKIHPRIRETLEMYGFFDDDMGRKVTDRDALQFLKRLLKKVPKDRRNLDGVDSAITRYFEAKQKEFLRTHRQSARDGSWVRVRNNPAYTDRPHYGFAKMDIKLLGTGLKIDKGEEVYMTPATNIPGGGFFARPAILKGIWKQVSENDSILIRPGEFDDYITYVKPRGEYKPTPQVKPDWKYGIYTGRGIARNPMSRTRYMLIERSTGKPVSDVRTWGREIPRDRLGYSIRDILTLRKHGIDTGRFKTVRMDEIRKNPPMYAHRMMSHRTHGLSLKQMMKLYRMVSSGNPKAVMFARRTLGIPMSESLQQVKAVVYHHVLDLKGKI
jgi:hypothetical protein